MKQLRHWALSVSHFFGLEFELPSRDPNYDGKELAKCLISSAEPPSSPIVSANALVRGTDIAGVRLKIVDGVWK